MAMVPSRWMVLGLLMVMPGVQAEVQAAAVDDEPPPMELLEFLGSFESADGKWIDPIDFEIPLPENRRVDVGGKKDE